MLGEPRGLVVGGRDRGVEHHRRSRRRHRARFAHRQPVVEIVSERARAHAGQLAKPAAIRIGLVVLRGFRPQVREVVIPGRIGRGTGDHVIAPVQRLLLQAMAIDAGGEHGCRQADERKVLAVGGFAVDLDAVDCRIPRVRRADLREAEEAASQPVHPAIEIGVVDGVGAAGTVVGRVTGDHRQETAMDHMAVGRLRTVVHVAGDAAERGVGRLQHIAEAVGDADQQVRPGTSVRAHLPTAGVVEEHEVREAIAIHVGWRKAQGGARRRTAGQVDAARGIAVVERRSGETATGEQHAPAVVVLLVDQVLAAIMVVVQRADDAADRCRKAGRLCRAGPVAEAPDGLPAGDTIAIGQVRESIAIEVQRDSIEGRWRREHGLEIVAGGAEALVVPRRPAKGHRATQDQQVAPAVAVEIRRTGRAIEDRHQHRPAVHRRAERRGLFRAEAGTRVVPDADCVIPDVDEVIQSIAVDVHRER